METDQLTTEARKSVVETHNYVLARGAASRAGASVTADAGTSD